jgi:Dna[CI] antecedent, DciA
MSIKKPLSIRDLLGSHGQRLGALRAGAVRAQSTLEQVTAVLPPDLAGCVHGAAFEADGRLTLLVESGAYASRLQYALPELLPKVLNADGQAADRGRVQVRPRGPTRA